MSKNLELVKNLKPYDVFKYFAEISDVPRGSGNTGKIVDYLVSFAIKNNLKYTRDNYNNVIITKETSGKSKSTIVLQAHIDMVCVKASDCNKDMVTEGIDFVLDGEWLKADRTTLGADDGIGMAIILSILTNEIDYERDIVGVFTDDEEIGLIGAHKIDLSNFDTKYLINIDNEELDVIDVGCAGGTQLAFEKKCSLTDELSGKLLEVEVGGLIGGHSGMEITKNRGNANKIIVDILYKLHKTIPFNLVNIQGGTFNNAIPNKAKVRILLEKDIDDLEITKTINQIIEEKLHDLKKNEPDISITYHLIETNEKFLIFNSKDTNDIINAIYELPDGLISTFENSKDIAETSLNLGILRTNSDNIYIEYLVRSNVNIKREKLNEEVLNIATKYNFVKVLDDSYPAWEYRKTELEDFTFNQFKKLFDKEPTIEITHGGLECGILLEKLPNVEAIAIGPTILGAHTTEERLKIKTVKHIQDLISEILLTIS